MTEDLIIALEAIDRAIQTAAVLAPGREVALARTKLDEARMWLEAVGR